jgi:hypothetical protein
MREFSVATIGFKRGICFDSGKQTSKASENAEGKRTQFLATLQLNSGNYG